ncbi:beta-galactosidase [Lachnospiraceae bacterium XBB2008]|nr:beta-galactosidase [Lachnospiraceae bacterium XBB2008]
MKSIWNEGWEFNLNDSPDELKNDEWSKVRIPHDWLIYDTTDLYRDGFGRYRKRFVVDKNEIGADAASGLRHISVIFDGVYMDSTYFLNGEKIGEWKYGYSQYILDLPDDKLLDGVNELVVAVNFKSPNSRWYSGAGIYRDVWFAVYPENYIPENGVYVHTEEREDGYLLYVDTCLNDSDAGAYIKVVNTLYDAAGKPVELIPTKASADAYVYDPDSVRGREKPFDESVYLVRDPHIWDISDPYLYSLKTSLISADDNCIQTVDNTVGFRNIRFDPAEGMFINGRRIKLNGVCEHHDLGLLGAEFNRSAMRRKIEILKTMGVNAIRGTHNMMAPGLLELCDEMGVLYLSEAFDMWNHPKTEFDYARFFDDWHERDVASWVRRDRNHPCVIMWSIGNEIADIHNYEKEGQEMTAHLMHLVACHDYRANAYITQGSNYMPWPNAQKCADILKVAGYNYGESCYEEHHAKHPDWIIYGSETSSITQSRGVYHLPLSANSLGEEDEQCSALGNSTTSWSAKSYEACVCIDRDTPYSLGQFLWSGFDYIGEPTPYKTRNSYFGQIDTAGFPKDSYWVWKSAWVSPDEDPFVHVFPYWDFNPGQTVDVRVVSNLPEVELFINGRSLGRQTLDHEPGSGWHIIADYSVPYEKGCITANAYKSSGSDEIAARCERHSFGNTDRPVVKRYEYTSTEEAQDIVYYEISAIDAEGYPVENACDRVSVSVDGPGRLIGLDNGNSADPDGYRVDNRRLFNGRLLAAVECDRDASADPEIRVAIVKDDPDVRRITLVCEEDRVLDPDHRTVKVKSYVEPGDSSGHDINYSIVDDMGIGSPLAKLEIIKPDSGLDENNGCKDIVIMHALGDGNFRLRATVGGFRQKVRVISDLEFEISGCGEAYRNPYEFIAGSTYSSSIGEVGSGNEKGFATARDGCTIVTFEGLDFGSYGADRITIPIFALDSDDVPLKVWQGVPGSGSEVCLLDTVYSKPRQWAVFIEDSWQLMQRVKGITSISFEFTQKVHVKGFIFDKADRAHARLLAAEADAIYGDEFTRTDTVVEGIGNNVSMEYKDMDFGAEGIDSITIWGHTVNETNPVHVRFIRDNENIREVCEFKRSDEYGPQTFKLPHIEGKWNVTFVFLPGSNFDFESFKFE